MVDDARAAGPHRRLDHDRRRLALVRAALRRVLDVGLLAFQSIVIVLVSALTAAGIMGAMWASWGMRFAR